MVLSGHTLRISNSIDAILQNLKVRANLPLLGVAPKNGSR